MASYRISKIYSTHFVFVVLSILFFSNSILGQTEKPNVILILTDDQGIGDLACQGNPWIQTPNIDKFYKESVRMTDFHVSPLCTPTRGAIMTGQYPINNGAWATYKGRDALSEGTTTMAKVFKENGYKTGLFGKWHLGDNYPVRPTDVGFDMVVQHKAGGVGELSDYWGNSYFDDVYYVNNKPKQFKGYCTDVWFEETMKFIDKNKDEPFFIYLPTNAPHSPLIVDEKYSKPYKHLEGSKIPSANFYGMITNIDENFGKLDAFLKEKGLSDNTILIYMTDNGSGNGISKDGKLGYNKGFRGKKGYRTEGGHRVPFFIRWVNGKISGGKDISNLANHVDLLPTLSSLCRLKTKNTTKLDGIDFSTVLTDNSKKLKTKEAFIHIRQDWRPPQDVENTCILKDQWRLINGKELYNVEQDPYQRNDISTIHPKCVKKLNKANKKFLKETKLNDSYQQLPLSIVGNQAQKEITLTIQHAIGDSKGIWKAEQVAKGYKSKNNTHAIAVEKEGWYEIACSRWPKECKGAIWGIPKENPKNLYEYEKIQPKKVRISIANQILEKKILGIEDEIIFKVKLPKGKTLLVNDFIEGNESYGVYYTYLRPI